MRFLLAALLLAACAGRKADGPPDTEVQVVDEAGEPLLGMVSLWSKNGQDQCEQYGSACTVAVPSGMYTMVFRKERAGRVATQIGGTVQSEKSAGCLKVKVKLVPGQRIACKKTGEFNCAKGAWGNMDCGAASNVYGYKPQPADEPPDAK